jgi:hypothetical protein
MRNQEGLPATLGLQWLALPRENYRKTLLTNTLVALLLVIGANLGAQPVPHHFSHIVSLPNRTVTLGLDGGVSRMFNLSGTVSNQFMQMFDLYLVEASANLVDWRPMALLLRTNNNPAPLLFPDTNALVLNQRFYRTPTNHLLTAFP